ncbi:hypothetical protein [Vibrio fluvialis]|uniref:hypothetical protein n=1 Tax=Vibrio fluvialis TaxID=676 RepID=UPI001F252988|nr:hypothetical protein [Vibrio fluvialis]MCE7659925.1 hypothetical protein [Vibrio fluvialis]
MKMLDIFLLVFSSSANNEGNFYFTENQIGIYLMLIIPTIIMIALLFYKVGSSVNYRKNTRIRTEKAEAISNGKNIRISNGKTDAGL